MFSILCEHAGLVEETYGQKHTMYSLRHSPLCFQILKTGGTDLFGLAQNALTSTEILEKFCVSHLTPQMPVYTRQLRSTRVLEGSEKIPVSDKKLVSPQKYTGIFPSVMKSTVI